MADVIERMLEPFDPIDLDIDRHRLLITVCATAWNLAVLEHHAGGDEPKLRSAIEEVRASSERIGMTALIEDLKKRKMMLFPDDRRFIVETSLKPLKRGDRDLTVSIMTLDLPEHAAAGAEDTRANETDLEHSGGDAPPAQTGDLFGQSRQAAPGSTQESAMPGTR